MIITWNNFEWFAISAIVLWLGGALFALFSKERSRWAILLTLLGITVFAVFIAGFWLNLHRPPLRTMGETRLWYSFFMGISGLLTYIRWKYPWILCFSTVVGAVFAIINILKPEIHDQSLMPALQSVWFVPHVIVYMFSYALLGAVTLFALYLWLRSSRRASDDEMGLCDNLVRIGWAFLSLGMVMGALWAKQAWGDYWTWDPKETWAAATWLGYLLYLHLRAARPKDRNAAFALIVFSFLLLQMCWYGINYLPAAQGVSIHTY